MTVPDSPASALGARVREQLNERHSFGSPALFDGDTVKAVVALLRERVEAEAALTHAIRTPTISEGMIVAAFNRRDAAEQAQRDFVTGWKGEPSK